MKENKKKICEVCGKIWEYKLQVDYNKDGIKTCRHDGDCVNDVIVTKRHQNLDASIEANRMANEQKRQDAQTNPMIPVRDNKTGKTEMLPEKVIESIKEKVKGEEALQE